MTAPGPSPDPVRIEVIEVRELAMPLASPFETSFSRVDAREVMVVGITAGGLSGRGEAPVARRPGFSYETTETAWHVIRDAFAPALLGQRLAGAADLRRALGTLRGHPMARAGLIGALEDLLARRDGVPLWRRLGGRGGRIPVGVSVGLEPTDEAVLARVERFVAAGYPRVKLKIRPGRDAALVRRVRERFPDLPLAADANGAYDPGEAAALRDLDAFGLLWIEQPFPPDDLLAHARLQAVTRTPVCLDESVGSAAEARTAFAVGACRAINVKPGRVGGLDEAVRIHDVCREAGVLAFVGGMLETGIGRAANVHLATLPHFTLAGDLSASDRYWAEDIIEPPFALGPGGTLAVPEGPGIGVDVVEERLARRTVRRAVYRAP